MAVLQLRVIAGLFFLHGPRDFVYEIVHALGRVVALAANAGGKLVGIAEGVDFVKARLDARNAHANGHFVGGIDEGDELVAGIANDDSQFAHGPVQDLGHLDKNLVAGEPSIIQVDFFKVVDVDQDA